jgi:hypothetical protein
MTSRKEKTSTRSMGRTLHQANEGQQRHLFHRMINLASTKVKDVEDTSSQKNAFQIITTEEKSFTVFTDTPEEKKAWMKDLIELTSNSQGKNECEMQQQP